MTGKKKGSHSSQGMKRSLNGRILKNTTLNILLLVVISCIVMAFSMQSLANKILLDSLQPMAGSRQRRWKPIYICWRTV